MTKYDAKAGLLLQQAEIGNAEHPVGVSKHRVWIIGAELRRLDEELERTRAEAECHSLNHDVVLEQRDRERERAEQAEAQRDRLERHLELAVDALRDVEAAEDREWSPVRIYRDDEAVARDEARHEMASELAEVARQALADIEKGEA